jgi:transmembrane 9 superfamily protein 2/4
VSSRVYATLGGAEKRKNTFVTATALPTCVVPVTAGPTMAYHDVQGRLWYSLLLELVLDQCRLVRRGPLRHVYFTPHHDLVAHSRHNHPGTMLLIIVLWFGISAPLSAIGSYFGAKHGVCGVVRDTTPHPDRFPGRISSRAHQSNSSTDPSWSEIPQPLGVCCWLGLRR